MDRSGSSGFSGVMDRFLARFARGRRRPGSGILDTCFGPLEIGVLEALWDRREATSVRSLANDFPQTAYTTLMTTLDRLFKKGVLVRHKAGRAYLYSASCRRSELEARLARDAFDLLFADRLDPARARLVISGLVDAVGDHDARLLDELERLVQAKRAEGPGGPAPKRRPR